MYSVLNDTVPYLGPKIWDLVPNEIKQLDSLKSFILKIKKLIPRRCLCRLCRLENKLIPKGLELSLEPNIGNCDQEFIDNWYSNLNDFSFILRKDIVKFLGKTIEETAKSIDETQIKLKQNLEKDEYYPIQNTIQINEKATKKTLQQRKFKKYNYIKHNPKPAAKATNFQEDNKNWVQPSYAQATARAPLKRTSLTNTNSKPNIKNTHT